MAMNGYREKTSMRPNVAQRETVAAGSGIGLQQRLVDLRDMWTRVYVKIVSTKPKARQKE